MKANLIYSRLLLLLFILAAGKNALADTTYIKFGAVWKYLDNGVAAPSGSGTADWRNISFNDAAWKAGPAELGYGANRERTTIRYGSNPDNKYITTYFRKKINIVDISNYSAVKINAYIDDGAVIYVNGAEVARTNIAGKPSYSTLAAYAEDNGNTISTFNIPAAAFISGNNTIAVEVHQAAVNSSDLAFDLELIAKPVNKPGANGVQQVMDEPDIVRGPYLQMVSGHAITIKWTTTTGNSSRVKYGTSETAVIKTITDHKSVTDHEMRITGLKPDTKYYYAIGSRNSIMKGSYRNYFTTSPPADTKRKIRIGVFGDPGTGTINQKGSRDSYLKLKGNYNNAEMIIMLGDNAYNAGTEQEHNAHFFNIYNNNIFDNHVIFTVPGNHEYANDATRAIDHNIPYYSIFTVPTHAESGGLASGTEHYYSYDYGNIHFIMLDSYGIDGGNHLYDDTTNGLQAVWLKADLAASAGKHKWTIVCLHHPPYTNGSHTSDVEHDLISIRRKITPILERYGVDVVLAGHSHVYERSFLIKDHIGFSDAFNKGTPPGGLAVSLSNARYDGSFPGDHASVDTSAANSSCPYFTIDSVYKHGTVYVVAGSAGQVTGKGGNTYPLFYTRNESTSDGGETGALYLEVQDNRLDAKFVGKSGIIRDQFTIMKGVNRNIVVPATINKPSILTASWIGGYNWHSATDASVPVNGSARTFGVTPLAAGNIIYYVSDSVSPKTTCLADTFTLQVTSSMAASVTKFDAVVKNKKVLVQWTTAQEINSDYFTVERSANGKDFDMVMVINGKGSTEAATHYEFIDNTPLQGTRYYRLIATDKNANREMVGVKTVRNQTNTLADTEADSNDHNENTSKQTR
ncbi:MAG: metallophosphoesterase family protein [Bacteroidota bacterium]